MINKLFNKALCKLDIFILYRFGNAIGEQLLLSALAAELKNKYPNSKIIIITDYPELFYNNQKIYKVFHHSKKDTFPKKIFWKLLKHLRGKRVHEFRFPIKTSKPRTDDMIETPYPMSLIEANSRGLDQNLSFKESHPEIFFIDSELKKYEKKFSLPRNYALINPQAKTSYTPNKDWGFEKFQEVVNRTKDEINWVQVGMYQDKLLDQVLDFRGKTPTIRELAYLLKCSDFVLANEGLFNHLAAAVDTRSYVVFGGFHPVEIANYKTTIPIVADNLPDCAPCWLLDKCPKPSMYCFEGVTPDKVVESIVKHEKLPQRKNV